jgi:hypothetical protein
MDRLWGVREKGVTQRESQQLWEAGQMALLLSSLVAMHLTLTWSRIACSLGKRGQAENPSDTHYRACHEHCHVIRSFICGI